MPYGYNGRILRVDLSEKTISEEEPPETVYRKYLGGSALALYHLLKELKPGTDPLGPENMLVFMSSVVSGVPMPGLTRFTVAARSPLTGAFGEAEAGGFWGPELKMAGFDGIIITGRSEKPVYLWIKDGKGEIRDASNLWGRDTGDVQRLIREELKDKHIRVAQCGQAGEHLVPYACVLNELKHASGRTGMGAVMGSKNLRAVAVRGTGKIATAQPESVKKLTRVSVERIPKTPLGNQLKRYGTPVFVMGLQQGGILPTRNFQEGRFEGAEKISGETMTETILEGPKGCYSCPVRCKRSVKVGGKYSATPEYGGPEYETLGSLGSLCGIDDLAAISHGNEICNRWGLDTISTGVCIAFAMECTERGILTSQDTDGIDLRFGNADAMIEMIRKIAFREGFGDLLAEGVKRASAKIGSESEPYALHVKGQEMAIHEPRGKFGVALSFALSPTGADHIEVPHDTSFVADNALLESIKPLGEIEPLSATELGPRKISQFAHTQQVFSLYNSLGICNFAAVPYSTYTFSMITALVEAVTGWNTSLFELLEVGERAATMARMFNVREGIPAAADSLPDRFFEPLHKGESDEKRLDKKAFSENLRLYYGAMGWDPETAIPTDGRLAYLRLDWLTAYP
ncbi:MAG: aldehyde ferredoxin oxidoreductase family protein [Deltaproteobacteria bacterium]|nr:aldehyde ferredoxin oxidoreductase family protein [Deltaproteobacteria bacterium]